MGNNVFANGRAVSCKAAGGKSICAFPDVCLSPPAPPAGPIPIPYPNTGMASDTTGGSKQVKISGKELMLKHSSSFKKSTGDEAATKSLGMSVITHQIQGAVYFNSWSMDVKVEGENVTRTLDLTTHNHASDPGATPPWPYTDEASLGKGGACKGAKEKEEKACGPLARTKTLKSGKKVLDKKATKAAQCKNKKCQAARKCGLTKYKPNQCCPGQTGHHLIEVHSFCHPGKPRGRPLPQFKKYKQDDAPVVCAACAKGSRYSREHGRLHAHQGARELKAMEAAARRRGGNPEFAWKYKDAREAGLRAHALTFPASKCSRACLKAQLDSYHIQKCKMKEDSPVRTETPPMQAWQKQLGTKALEKTGRVVVRRSTAGQGI